MILTLGLRVRIFYILQFITFHQFHFSIVLFFPTFIMFFIYCEDKMVLVFNLQKAEIPIYMPFTSKGVPFEDQNYFINRISH